MRGCGVGGACSRARRPTTDAAPFRPASPVPAPPFSTEFVTLKREALAAGKALDMAAFQKRGLANVPLYVGAVAA